MRINQMHYQHDTNIPIRRILNSTDDYQHFQLPYNYGANWITHQNILDDFMYIFISNRGVLMTSFHNMAALVPRDYDAARCTYTFLGNFLSYNNITFLYLPHLNVCTLSFVYISVYMYIYIYIYIICIYAYKPNALPT